MLHNIHLSSITSCTITQKLLRSLRQERSVALMLRGSFFGQVSAELQVETRGTRDPSFFQNGKERGIALSGNNRRSK